MTQTTQPNDIQTLNGESMDLTEHNIEQLKALFPSVFKEGKIDFEALKAELGENLDESNERYQFTWAGKEQAKRIATTPTLGTLRPAPAESVNWDNTENLYIEGDNLEVLKLLQKSYFGKVKMIYIDPPYNTGKDFVYKDDFKDNLANYQRLTGQKDKEGNPLTTNSDSAGRYHSNWLNLIYPRLKLARNLLRDDGVIFISIDDKEVHNLRKICDEIFGDMNFLADIIWEKVHTRKNSAKTFSISHDHIIAYAKVKDKWDRLLLPRENTSAYTNPDNDPKGPWKPDPITAHNYYSAEYKVTKPNGVQLSRPQDRYWVYSWDTWQQKVENNEVIWGDGESYPMVKRYLAEVQDGLVPTTIFSRTFAGDTSKAKGQLTDLIGLGGLFDYPKPTDLIKRLLQISTRPNELVMDFFSGSGTTLNAVMELNSQDQGQRKCIVVQIPEPTPENSEARNAGYATIAEIGKERIRRAAKKIKDEHPDTTADLGFKVFKLDTSNIKKWQPNVDDLDTDLLNAVDNIVDGRTSQDLLFEVLIKYGLPLTLPIEQIQLNNYQVWNVANNSLIACFDENITLETVQAIADLSTAENPVLRVVFRDTSFKDDITKTNAIQRLKQAGIEDVLSI